MADDDRPIERSARKRPTAHPAIASSSSASTKKSKTIDPRFHSAYGSFQAQHYDHRYQFLTEQREQEQQVRYKRIKRLHTMLRRFAVEEHNHQEEGGEDDEAYDLSETEREVFLDGIDEEDTTSVQAALRELAILKRTPKAAIQEELQQLKRETTLYRSQVGEQKAKSRVAEVRKAAMKAEVKAVKDGTKQKPYFMKRKDVKEKIAADTFDKLDQRGGKLMVDKYLERKQKRRR